MSSLLGRTGAGIAPASRRLSPSRIFSPSKRTQARSRRYLSLSHLRALHGELVVLLDEATAPLLERSGDKRDSRLIEILRSIAELVAFGEAADEPEFFEFFSEKAIMASFVKALCLGPAIQTQVIQGISILFQNMDNPTSLYMLLSQDHINRLIQPESEATKLPLHDEEFLSNYVALLKAISVRLSKETVQFFLNVSSGSFPLYSSAVPLIAHPDSMVRTSALNITLHIFSMKDPGVKAFLAREENHGGFFVQLSRLLQDAYSQILCRVWQTREPSEEVPAVEGATTFFQDMLYYVQDLLDASDDELMAETLALHLQSTFFRPAVLEGLVEAFHGGESHRNGEAIEMGGALTGTSGAAAAEGASLVIEKEPEVQLALYALCQFFLVATNTKLLKLMVEDLLGCEGARSEARTQDRQGNGVSSVIPDMVERQQNPGDYGDFASRPDNSKGRGKVPGSIAGDSSEECGGGGRVGDEIPVRSSGSVCCRGKYRRALLACMAQREGGQIRLGAIALVRCLARSLLTGKTKFCVSEMGPVGSSRRSGQARRRVGRGPSGTSGVGVSVPPLAIPAEEPTGGTSGGSDLSWGATKVVAGGMEGSKGDAGARPGENLAVGSAKSMESALLGRDPGHTLPEGELGVQGGSEGVRSVWVADMTGITDVHGLSEQRDMGDDGDIGGGGCNASASSEPTATAESIRFTEKVLLEQERRPVLPVEGLGAPGGGEVVETLAGDGAVERADAAASVERGNTDPEILDSGKYRIAGGACGSGGERGSMIDGLHEGSHAGVLHPNPCPLGHFAGGPRTQGVIVLRREPPALPAFARVDNALKVMAGLLRALAWHPVSRTVDVHTAAAAVEELHLFESRLVLPRADHDHGIDAEGRENSAEGGVHQPPEGTYSGYQGLNLALDDGSEHFSAMLGEAYAASAEVLLGITTCLEPFALLRTFERAVDILEAGSVTVGGARGGTPGFPAPALDAAAGDGLLHPEEPQKQLPAVFRRAAVEDMSVVHVQTHLILRSLYERLVEGRGNSSRCPTETSAAIPFGSVHLGSDVLSIAGVQPPVDPPRVAIVPTTTTKQSRGSPGAQRPDVSLPSPRFDRSGAGARGERTRRREIDQMHRARGTGLAPSRIMMRLSGKRCVACRLPHNWPFPAPSPSGLAVASASKKMTNTERRSGAEHPHLAPQAAPRELYAIMDDKDFLLAAPDPTSVEDGYVMSAAPLRNTVARPHPADLRVMEVRVSTKDGGGLGPGLFLATARGLASGPGDGPASGTSFRGAGHRGLWHLVLVFETAAACKLVAEHIEEQREAILAARTVALVEMLRRTTMLRSAPAVVVL